MIFIHSLVFSKRKWTNNLLIHLNLVADNAYILCFRFKFYPIDPILLKEEVTRYQLVLQLRRDILHGRLYSTPTDMATVIYYTFLNY